MNRFLRVLGTVIGCLFLAGTGFGQEKVTLTVSGRAHGKVDALQQAGTTYVDVQKMSRKLGTSVEVFARSKQAKITTRGFYAILTASSNEVLLNAAPVPLSAPVLEQNGVIMAPVSFFLLPQFQEAVGKELSFRDGILAAERQFDLEHADNVLTAGEDQLVFKTRHAVTWQADESNPRVLKVTFPNSVIKRDEYFRLKTGIISAVHIEQVRADGLVKITRGKKGKYWDVAEADGKMVIRLSAKPLPPYSKAATEAKSTVPESVQTSVSSVAASKPSATVEVPAPSVLEADAPAAKEDPKEKPVAAKELPKIGPAAPEKPQPVIAPAPPPVITSAHKKMRIVVDPGHGGKDPGAMRARVREKDLNLAVSKELFKLLKKGGFEVKITRDNDTFIALSERSKIANNFKADLFVSVHTNASKNKQANGFQVYFRSDKATDKEAAETAALENEAMQYEEVHYNFVDALLQSLAKNEYINESSKLAGYVRNAVYKQPGIGIAVSQSDSVRQANFYVLKGVQSPSILVEMGFISSQKDRGRLTQSAVQKKMAQGIYNGIYNYAKKEGWIN